MLAIYKHFEKIPKFQNLIWSQESKKQIFQFFFTKKTGNRKSQFFWKSQFLESLVSRPVIAARPPGALYVIAARPLGVLRRFHSYRHAERVRRAWMIR